MAHFPGPTIGSDGSIFMRKYGLGRVTILGALYPAVWGTAQLATGALSDRFGRKLLIASGNVLQGIAILVMPLTDGFAPWATAAALLGIGQRWSIRRCLPLSAMWHTRHGGLPLWGLSAVA